MDEKETRSMHDVKIVMRKSRDTWVKALTSSAIRWSGLSISFEVSRE